MCRVIRPGCAFLKYKHRESAVNAISSANGLLLKGGKEAYHSNKILHRLVGDALEPYVSRDAIGLVSQLH